MIVLTTPGIAVGILMVANSLMIGQAKIIINAIRKYFFTAPLLYQNASSLPINEY
jgi:hypothetical protein